MVLTYSTMMQLGTAAPDFELPVANGGSVRLEDFVAGRPFLIVFTCNHCPYALAVEDRLVAIGRDYAAQLAMLAINSNDATQYPEDSFDAMKARAAEKQFPYPYLFDEDQQVARAYDAACTPDCFLFDAAGKLVYRGRIDDNWKEPENVTRQELREAIDAVLAGQAPSADQKASMGCNIKWKS